MKKQLLIGITLALVTSISLANRDVNLSVNAKETEGITVGNFFNWDDDTLSFYDEKGVHGIREFDDSDPFSNGIGLTQQLNVSEGRTVTFTFQIPDYKHDDRTLIDGHVGTAQIPYDIYIMNPETKYYSIYRLWAGKSATVGENRTWVSYCEQETSNWTEYPGGYCTGACTDGSSFTFSFDTTDFLKVALEKDGQVQMVPFYELSDAADTKDEYLDFISSHYGNAKYIEVWFAHQRLIADTKNEIVISDINGQSLRLVNGKLNDDVAPIVDSIKTSKEEYEIGNEYSLRLERYFGDPSTDATFYVHPTSDSATDIDDLLRGSKLLAKHSSDSSYKEIGTLDAPAAMINKITFDKVGEWSLKLEVTDKAGNVGESKELSINVVKGYGVSLNGEVAEVGNVGSEITLPDATATDKDNVSRDVIIEVEDPIGNKIEVKNRKFTPTIQGIYYVTYYSTFVNDKGETITSSKLERQILVGEALPKEDKKGCKGSATTSLFAIPLLGLLLELKKRSKK